ncbi:hypothetical protein D3C78_1500070 [compost metagenome]
MERDELERLTDMLQNPEAPSKHVGIKNVQERIKSVCGETYGLSINSRKHIGTSVLMVLPIKEGNEHDTSHIGG